MDTKTLPAGDSHDDHQWWTETEILDTIKRAYNENRSPEVIFARKRLNRMADEVERLRKRYGLDRS